MPAEKTDDPALQCKTPGCRNKRPRANRGHRRFCWKCLERRKREERTLQYQYQRIRTSAKKRNIPFQITPEEWEWWCNQTGYLRKKGRGKDNMSIGRIDHSKGYTLSNIELENFRWNCVKGKTIPNEEDPF